MTRWPVRNPAAGMFHKAEAIVLETTSPRLRCNLVQRLQSPRMPGETRTSQASPSGSTQTRRSWWPLGGPCHDALQESH
jgi:hypothetical protein